jgi:hypothetical protein
MGARLPRRNYNGLQFWRGPSPLRRLRLVREKQQSQVQEGRPAKAKSLGLVRHARQHLGMVLG